MTSSSLKNAASEIMSIADADVVAESSSFESTSDAPVRQIDSRISDGRRYMITIYGKPADNSKDLVYDAIAEGIKAFLAHLENTGQTFIKEHDTNLKFMMAYADLIKCIINQRYPANVPSIALNQLVNSILSIIF